MKNFMTHDFTIDKVIYANFVGAGVGAVVHKNRPSHGLAIFLCGERTYFFEDKKITVDKGTILYFPKGSNYTFKEWAPTDCYAINFQMPDDVVFEPFAMKAKNMNAYVESFKHSQRVWTRKNNGYRARMKSELYNIIYNMQAEYSIPYTNSAVIEPAIKYIHLNYNKETISVEYLASLCNISTVHLRNMFMKRFAVPPIKYINNLKINQAADLLASRFYTVSEACALAGYSDESHFCRVFKKHFNVTPSEYMKTGKELHT